MHDKKNLNTIVYYIDISANPLNIFLTLKCSDMHKGTHKFISVCVYMCIYMGSL